MHPLDSCLTDPTLSEHRGQTEHCLVLGEFGGIQGLSGLTFQPSWPVPSRGHSAHETLETSAPLGRTVCSCQLDETSRLVWGSFVKGSTLAYEFQCHVVFEMKLQDPRFGSSPNATACKLVSCADWRWSDVWSMKGNKRSDLLVYTGHIMDLQGRIMSHHVFLCLSILSF